jgi:hypothetical protein
LEESVGGLLLITRKSAFSILNWQIARACVATTMRQFANPVKNR